MLPRQILLFASGFSVAALAVALVAQYGLELHPCHLCIYQRYPYAIIALIGLLAAWRGSLDVQKKAVLVCAALFFVDAGIAFYHTGVELQWFPGPSGCTSSSTGGESLEELRRQIMEAPLVACDQPMAYFFGLSFAGWNTITACCAGILTLVAFRRGRKQAA